VEIIYLAERGRLPALALKRLEGALREGDGGMVVAPLDAGVAETVRESRELFCRRCRIALLRLPLSI
jgi:hypothetical protein